MKTDAAIPKLLPRRRFPAVLSLTLGLLLSAAAWAQDLQTATAVATVVNGFVIAVTVTDGGAGYKVPPVVTISGGEGSGAWAEAIVTDGTVSSVIVRGAGSGYTSTPIVVIAPPPPPEAPVIESVRLQAVLTIRGQVGTTNSILAADMPTPDHWRVLTSVVVTNSPYVFVDIEASPWQRYYLVSAGPEIPPFPVNTNRWAWIPPGTFIMGSPEGEKDRRSDEGPQTGVTLELGIYRGFYMGRYEVTQGEYAALMGSNPSSFKGETNRPVERVTWHDATNYCSKLTAQERAAGRLPAGYEYRLPTEAQWEYACRAGTTNRFSFGDDLWYAQLGNFAWYGGNSGNTTHPVGAKLANPWGLYDMHGNVWEWCLDWYAASLPGDSLRNPDGPASGSFRVIRGGCWGNDGRYCRTAVRDRDFPSNTYAYFGFRVALVAVTWPGGGGP